MEIEKEGNIYSQEINELLVKEREARVNNDYMESIRITMQIVEISYKTGNVAAMCDLLSLLTKKRGQPKKAVVDMVEFGMKAQSEISNPELRFKLITTLKDICDKKIYLEVNYARCCLLIVKQKETSANIDEAAKILQDVQVETYGSMEIREKLDFILYQMKLMLLKKDLIRFLIVSKKINVKNLEEKGLEDIKVQYYAFMVDYYNQEGMYMEAAHACKNIFDVIRKDEMKEKLPSSVQFDFPLDKLDVLQQVCAYFAISPVSPKKEELQAELSSKYIIEIEKNPACLQTLKTFSSKSLVSCNVHEYSIIATRVFKLGHFGAEQHLKDFYTQLIHKDICILNLYFQRLEIKRGAELLDVPTRDFEKQVCALINSKTVQAKIDQVAGYINFTLKRGENQVLDYLSTDMHKALDLIEKTTNLITREIEKAV